MPTLANVATKGLPILPNWFQGYTDTMTKIAPI